MRVKILESARRSEGEEMISHGLKSVGLRVGKMLRSEGLTVVEEGTGVEIVREGSLKRGKRGQHASLLVPLRTVFLASQTTFRTHLGVRKKREVELLLLGREIVPSNDEGSRRETEIVCSLELDDKRKGRVGNKRARADKTMSDSP